MRYLVDERGIDPSASLALHRALIQWAAARGERFVMQLDASVYDDKALLERLCGLGEVRTAAPPTEGRDLLSWLVTSVVGPRGEVRRVEGRLSPDFTRELASNVAPPRAVAGDVSPAEDVMILVGERVLYAMYDYGRTQVLDLTEGELEQLRSVIVAAGLDAERLVSAPPYLTGPGGEGGRPR